MEKCTNCGYEWVRRTPLQPVRCPKCKKRYYGRGKVLDGCKLVEVTDKKIKKKQKKK